MVGSYGPKTTEYEYLTPVEEAPKGMLARGTYTIKSKFTDDDKHDHLSWEWSLTIKKDWKEWLCSSPSSRRLPLLGLHLFLLFSSFQLIDPWLDGVLRVLALSVQWLPPLGFSFSLWIPIYHSLFLMLQLFAFTLQESIRSFEKVKQCIQSIFCSFVKEENKKSC